MPERVDAIVIGTGQAGPALCARLDREGLKTVVIERKLIGGTCVNNGCIPTKTLIASAHAAHVARRGGEYGFYGGRDPGRHARGQGAQGWGGQAVLGRPDRLDRRHEERDARARARALHRTAHGRGERPHARGRQGVHQRGRKGVGARPSRREGSPVPHQHHDDGGGFPARAPGDRRRELHRPRVRADVSPLRLEGDRGRARAAAHRARGRRRLRRDPRDPRARGDRDPHRRRVHGALEERRRGSSSGSNARTARRSPRAATCCSRWVGCRTRRTSGSKARA